MSTDRPAGIRVRAERLVAGGAALCRQDDGRIVLVDGALPSETIDAIVEERKGTLHGTVHRVLEASPDRIVPRCDHVAAGCGGCDLAAMGHDAQLDAKVELVRDALVRIGRWREPVLRSGPMLAPWAFRTTMRVAVLGGRAALRVAASHDTVAVPQCEIAHPLLAELLVDGRFGDATEAVLRVAPGTGERIVVVAPSTEGVVVPDDVLLVGSDELRAGRRAWIHDELVGRRWRISAGSFFQSRTDGAAALVDTVAEMVGDVLDDGGGGTLVDAYCGVGLFAGALLDGRVQWRAVAAERGRSSVADAKVNLADLDSRVVSTSIERFRAPTARVVVADPSREGLGRGAVRALTATRAERFVLVSCDPAAAARDLRLLVGEGYRPVESVLVDLFPHSHHVEVVTRFDG